MGKAGLNLVLKTGREVIRKVLETLISFKSHVLTLQVRNGRLHPGSAVGLSLVCLPLVITLRRSCHLDGFYKWLGALSTNGT